ncbi:hypothetical protein JCM10296v2_003675 [Rhodotorula toruloides]
MPRISLASSAGVIRPATWHLVIEYREPARDEAIPAKSPVADAHSSAAEGTSTPPTDGAEQQASADISTEASPSAADAPPKLRAAHNEKSVEDAQVPVPDAASSSAAPRPARREIFDLMNAFVADFDKHLAALFPGASASARPSVPDTSETSKNATSRNAKAVNQDAESVAHKPQDNLCDAFTPLFQTVEAIMAEGDKTFRRVHDELNKRMESEDMQDDGNSSSPQVRDSDEVPTATSPNKGGSAAPSASPSPFSKTADTVNAHVDEVIRQAKELGAKVEKLETEERDIGTKQEGNEGKESARKEEAFVA